MSAWRVLVLGAAAGAVLTAGQARAEVTQTDILVAGRAVGFVEKLHAGNIRLAIVYAPDSAPSMQQARELQSLLGDRFIVGNMVLRPSLVRVDQVGTAGTDIFFLTEGLGAAAAPVTAASREKKIPCITFDLPQVRNGACTIGVQSRPRIDVFVNRKAAEESGTVFSNVFRLMITEF